jgi:AhpC/TSA family
MSPSEHAGPEQGAGGHVRRKPGYGGYAGLLALVILALITINTIVTKPNGVTGIPPGQPLAPFAVPLVLGNLQGDANIATHADQGAAGQVPACAVRGPQILNICQLYERSPVVLALFVDGGSCAAVVGELQQLAPSFSGVRFAAVSIKGDREQLRELVRSKQLTMPVGIDTDGALAALYKLASCPQVSFAYPGGVVQSKALLHLPSPAALRARVSELVAASRQRGWKAPAR